MTSTSMEAMTPLATLPLQAASCPSWVTRLWPVQGGVLSAGARPKSKTAAVLLAVFLTFWTWCYTYKRDAWKFWLNLVLSVVTLGIWAVTVAWLWAIIDVAVKPSEYYAQFPNYGVTTRAA